MGFLEDFEIDEKDEESAKPNSFSRSVVTFELTCDDKGFCDEKNFERLLHDNNPEEFIKVRLPCNIDADCLWSYLATTILLSVEEGSCQKLWPSLLFDFYHQCQYR